ncbi:MAG: hypothetical protein RLZZ574_1848, partial [Cyanobacteriota bacterium]
TLVLKDTPSDMVLTPCRPLGLAARRESPLQNRMFFIWNDYV